MKKTDLSSVINQELVYEITSSEDFEDLIKQLNKINKTNISFDDVILTKKTKNKFYLYANNSSKDFSGKVVVSYKIKKHLTYKAFLGIIVFFLYTTFAIVIPLGLKQMSLEKEMSLTSPLILTGIICGAIAFILLVALIIKYPIGMNNKQKKKFQNQ